MKMKLLTCLLVALLISCAISCGDLWGDERPPYYSDRLVAFISMYNGYYPLTPSPDDGTEESDPANVEGAPFLKVVPVNVPIFRPAVTYYSEFSAVGGGVNNNLVVVDDKIPGKVRLRQYQFKNASNYMSGQFRLTALYNIRPSELTTVEDCGIEYTRDGPTRFVGVWPQCFEGDDPENRVVFESTLTCNTIDFLGPDVTATDGSTSRARFYYVRSGQRYSLPFYYVERSENSPNPCEA